jgi:hypothetical protein
MGEWQQQWVNGGSIDEFIRLLNMRQRAIEETGAPCLRVLYLDTLFSAYVHPPAFPAVSSTALAAEQLEYMLGSRQNCVCRQHQSESLGL